MFSIKTLPSEAISIEEKKKKIILFFGVSGVGKTYFSKALSEEIGATYLEKDIVSDALLPKGERYFSPYYDAYVKDQSYEVLYALAHSNLANGKTIIIDGYFAPTRLSELINIRFPSTKFQVMAVYIHCSA